MGLPFVLRAFSIRNQFENGECTFCSNANSGFSPLSGDIGGSVYRGRTLLDIAPKLGHVRRCGVSALVALPPREEWKRQISRTRIPKWQGRRVRQAKMAFLHEV